MVASKRFPPRTNHHDEHEKVVSLGRGFNLILVLNLLFGHWFRVPPLRLHGAKCIIAWTIIIPVNSLIIIFGVTTLYNMIYSLSNLSIAFYLLLGFFGVMQSVFRGFYIILKSNKVGKIINMLKKLLNHSKFKPKQYEIINRISRYTYWLVTFYVVLYVVCITTSAVNMTHELGLDKNARMKVKFDNNVSMDLIETWSKTDVIFRNIPNSAFPFYTFVIYVEMIVCTGKIMATEMMFLLWYQLILEEFDLLIGDLNESLSQSKKSSANFQLASWLEFQHDLKKILQSVNSITAPCVILTVIVNTLQMCLIAYLAVKEFTDLLNTCVLLVYAFMALVQTFLYCNFGQQIRNKVSRLHESAYRSSWLGSRRDTQHAALMICSAATERTLSLPGEPFFALSLEFFASIIGAVLTYLIVLLQMK